MHRAIGRVIRGQCRKFREDCPVAAGEDVRRNNKDDDAKNGFVPPKHSLGEAVAWTMGLSVAYQLTHHHRRHSFIETCSPVVSSSGSCSILSPETADKSGCPFSLASKVLSQPIFTSQPSSSALSVCQRKVSSTSAVISSIDLTPFIHDDAQESEIPNQTTPNVVEDDDIVFGFESDSEAIRKQLGDEDLVELVSNNQDYGTKFGADMLSVLGAFEFLQAETKAKSSTASASSQKTVMDSRVKSKSRASKQLSSKNPPVRAMELLKRGVDLGSARAMYNIGVAYERMNDILLAKEYYKRAADLGHPLATYNCAVFALTEGHLTEGYALMKAASDFGVPEAEEFLTPSASGKALSLNKVQVGKV